MKTRTQKKAAEAEAKAAEAELRAGNSASENTELKEENSTSEYSGNRLNIGLRGVGEGAGYTPARFNVNGTRRDGSNGRIDAQQTGSFTEQAAR